MKSLDKFLEQKGIEAKEVAVINLVAETEFPIKALVESQQLNELLGTLGLLGAGAAAGGALGAIPNAWRAFKQKFGQGFQQGYDPQGHFQQYQKQAIDALGQLKAHVGKTGNQEYARMLDAFIHRLNQLNQQQMQQPQQQQQPPNAYIGRLQAMQQQQGR